MSPSRFIPGTVLAKRYRIVSMLGSGGMGEVYRADDLKLGQPVALKFLPAHVQRDSAWLDRLLHEVKTALRVSHPNVCRVHDVGEVDGQHYISMEYIDGEDLDSLLRRVGRLPGDRALRVAHQICVGLAAAHDQGILHRDLKPANVMIDGRGRAKITDFGLARMAEDSQTQSTRAGTPAYMSPEQFLGEEVTVRSDVYALGLVLYQLFTGKPAFEAANIGEYVRLHLEAAPSRPSESVPDIDSAVERVILRCLEKRPDDRPASALAVAAALPGGDPLAAALAAGDTPSPEMVADAGGEGSLRPWVAGLLLLIVVVGRPATVPLGNLYFLSGQVSLEKPPEALTVEAREIIRQTGLAEAPGDSFHWFVADTDFLGAEVEHDPAEVQPPPVQFWYRQGPHSLVTDSLRVARDRPPPIVPNMASVTLAPDGRLLRLRIVPPAEDVTSAATEQPDWTGLFERAGLDLASFEPTAPERNPLLDCDARAAWLGGYPEGPDVPIRVEAGSYRGAPVYFEVVPPWRTASRTVPVGGLESVSTGGVPAWWLVMTPILWIATVPLALRNLRRGRGDRKGAFRLALFVFAAFFFVHVLVGHHGPVLAELEGLIRTLALALVMSATFWTAYVALEPYVRRLWPKTLVSWSRLLAGRFRDPGVGRDVLVGGAAMVLTHAMLLLYHLPESLGGPATRPLIGNELTSLAGVRQAAGMLLLHVVVAFILAVYILVLILVLRLVLQRMWVAVLAFMLLFALLTVTVGQVRGGGPAMVVGMLLIFATALFVLVRFGLLAVIAWWALDIQDQLVLTLDPSSWYFGRSLAAMLVVAAVAAYAFYTSLGGRPLFRDRVLDPVR